MQLTQLSTMPHRRCLLAILGVALALRLGLFAAGPAQDIQRAYLPDSTRYVDLAQNLLDTGTFALTYEDASTVHGPVMALRDELGQSEHRTPLGHRPEIFRTPGYPVFIAAFLGLRLPLHAVLVTQCLLSAASVCLVYAIGRDLLRSRNVGLAAAALLAVNPADIDAANALLSEPLFTCLMLLGVWLAARRPTTTVAGDAGLLLGLATLVRPVGVMLGPAVALWMLATRPRRSTLAPAAFLVAASLVLPITWMARNDTIGFDFALSSVPKHNAWFYTAAYMDIARSGGDFAADWPPTVARLMDELKAGREPGEPVYDAANRLANERILAEPLLYAHVMARSIAKFFTDHSMNSLYERLGMRWQPTGLRDALLSGDIATLFEHGPSPLLALVWTAWNVALAIGTLAGLLTLAIQRRWREALLLTGVIAYFVLATQAVGLERFRLPIVGLQGIIAVHAIASLIAAARRPAAVEDGADTAPITRLYPPAPFRRAA